MALKPLGDGFIALVKMLISPIIFCTVVLGIAGAGDMKKVGRVGGKALLYFEVVSTFALVIGLVVANLIRPGAGFNVDPATLDSRAVADYAKVAASQSTVEFLLHMIPRTFFDAFTGSGDLLQVLLRRRAVRLCHDPHGPGGQRRPPGDRDQLAHLLPHHERDHEAGAARRRRGDGVHDRALRGRCAEADGVADGQLLSHLHPVRAGRAGQHCRADRVQHRALHRLHQGGAADRARHLVIGVRARAADAEARTAGLLEVGGRAGRAGRLLLQPRRHQHLPDDGVAVRGAGAQHRPDAEAGARRFSAWPC